MKHLIMRLESPLMSFGGETIDNLGVIRRFPAKSMITGIFANALGYERWEREKHQELQDRLIFATRIDREPTEVIQDFQTAKLNKNDKGWTTLGVPECRAGDSYKSPHLRYRDYFADMCVTVSVRLRDINNENGVTTEDLGKAIKHPKRPLFIGRKNCIPSSSMFVGFVEEHDCVDAIVNTPIETNYAPDKVSVQWEKDECLNDYMKINRSHILTDERNWMSGVHGGGRLVFEGTIDKNKIVPIERG